MATYKKVGKRTNTKIRVIITDIAVDVSYDDEWYDYERNGNINEAIEYFEDQIFRGEDKDIYNDIRDILNEIANK